MTLVDTRIFSKETTENISVHAGIRTDARCLLLIIFHLQTTTGDYIRKHQT